MLDHSLLVYRKNPVYLRIVEQRASLTLAKDYAAAGYHVAVTRGLGGGCKDLAFSISGTDPKAACKLPLVARSDSAALVALWDKAATLYYNAYSIPDLRNAVQALRVANAAADQAYGAEGVEPPRDPVTKESEAPMAYKSGMSWWIWPAAIGGFLMFAGVFKKKGKKGKGKGKKGGGSAKLSSWRF